VAQTDFQGKAMRIWQAEVVPDGPQAAPGSVVAGGKAGIEVATGQGLLRIMRLQMPGKRAMTSREFLNAHRVEGIVFG